MKFVKILITACFKEYLRWLLLIYQSDNSDGRRGYVDFWPDLNFYLNVVIFTYKCCASLKVCISVYLIHFLFVYSCHIIIGGYNKSLLAQMSCSLGRSLNYTVKI